MQKKPLLVLAALAAAADPDLGRSVLSRLKDGVKETYGNDPIGTTVTTVLVASWLFYRAERGHNPKVTSFYDALVYISTNLSVGYSDIFAKTEAGKTIGSTLMTFGPAMTANLFEDFKVARAPAPSPSPSALPADRAVLDRLDRILEALESR